MSTTAPSVDRRSGDVLTQGRPPGFWPARIAVAGAGVWAAAVVLGTAVQPDTYNSIRDTISVLAAKDARFGAIMVLGFLAMATALAAASLALWKALPFLSGRAAAVLVLIASGAMAVAGLARVECNPALAACRPLLESSTSTTVHGRAALFVFAPLVIAGFLLARALLRVKATRFGLIALAVAVADVVLVFSVEDASTSIAGLLQRVFVVLATAMPVAIAWTRRT